MKLALRLARREMRSGLGGFRLFIACLALGVTAIAAIAVTPSARQAMKRRKPPRPLRISRRASRRAKFIG